VNEKDEAIEGEEGEAILRGGGGCGGGEGVDGKIAWTMGFVVAGCASVCV
jgi:hypothetical protein